jgi:hypothetical protein
MNKRQPPHTHASLLACKKSKEPTVVQPGDSPLVVTSGIRQRIQQNIQDTIREARNDALRRYVDLRPHERVRYSHGPVVGLTPSSRTTPGAFPHQLGEAR